MEETARLVTYAMEEEYAAMLRPVYMIMDMASNILGKEIPPFEEFIKVKKEVKSTRTSEEIENDFEEIIKKARESQNGVNL